MLDSYCVCRSEYTSRIFNSTLFWLQKKLYIVWNEIMNFLRINAINRKQLKSRKDIFFLLNNARKNGKESKKKQKFEKPRCGILSTAKLFDIKLANTTKDVTEINKTKISSAKVTSIKQNKKRQHESWSINSIYNDENQDVTNDDINYSLKSSISRNNMKRTAKDYSQSSMEISTIKKNSYMAISTPTLLKIKGNRSDFSKCSFDDDALQDHHFDTSQVQLNRNDPFNFSEKQPKQHISTGKNTSAQSNESGWSWNTSSFTSGVSSFHTVKSNETSQTRCTVETGYNSTSIGSTNGYKMNRYESKVFPELTKQMVFEAKARAAKRAHANLFPKKSIVLQKKHSRFFINLLTKSNTSWMQTTCSTNCNSSDFDIDDDYSTLSEM